MLSALCRPSVLAVSVPALASLALLAPAAAQTQAPPATLTVQADKPLHAVSPTLYGLMTEEINYSYDGGLYAEMVRNRTFTHDWMGVPYWMLDNAGDAQATLKWDETDGPSEALQSSVVIDVTKASGAAPVRLRNNGWWGMALQPHTAYNLSFYLRTDTPAAAMRVALVNDDTGTVEAESTMADGFGSSWARHTTVLTTKDVKTVSAHNHLELQFLNAGKYSLQLVSLMPPTYKNRANGNRIDLMKMMAAMHPAFLRLPGGNYLEGNYINERFDWTTTLGPLVDRPTHRGPWGYQSSDGMGLLEFLEWTEDLKIEPVLAVYAGYSLKGDHIIAGPAMQPFVDDALNEIEFVIGDTSTKWGAMRAKLGHPAPFPLHYVEVGNEDNLDHSGSYESRFPQFLRAIKAKYPQLQVIATAPVKRSKPDVVDDHYYKRAEDFFSMVHHYDDADRNGPKIFVGEWATREGGPTTDWGAALGDAAWMTGMERNSDLIVMAAYAPLFVNVNPGGMQWESNLIGYNAAHSYGAPSYYVQSVFADLLGTSVPTSNITGGSSRFFYSVTTDAAKHLLFLKMVNASTEAQTLHVQLQGAHVAPGPATLWTLHGNTRSETNTIDDPKRITPQKHSATWTDTTDHTVPPLTVEVLELHTR